MEKTDREALMQSVRNFNKSIQEYMIPAAEFAKKFNLAMVRTLEELNRALQEENERLRKK